MVNKKFLPGAAEYFLMERKDRPYLNQLRINDSLAEKRIEFRESFLNEIVHRIANAHNKIELLCNQLVEYDKAKAKLYIADVTLETEIIEDALGQNVLNMAEFVKHFYVSLESDIHSKFGDLFRRVSRHRLKKLLVDEEVLQEYSDSRLFLFPELDCEAVNVSRTAILVLSKKLETESEKLKAFRDKIIAHKYDEKRFETHLTYQEYLAIYVSVVKILDAISIVSTLRLND